MAISAILCIQLQRLLNVYHSNLQCLVENERARSVELNRFLVEGYGHLIYGELYWNIYGKIPTDMKCEHVHEERITKVFMKRAVEQKLLSPNFYGLPLDFLKALDKSGSGKHYI